MFRSGIIPMFFLLAAVAMGAVTETQVREWRGQMRRDLFVSTPLPDLKPERHGVFEPEPGILAERITYQTAYGLKVPAILYRPASYTGKLPGILVVNGHGGDKYSWYSFYSGILYARAGAEVLTYDAIGEGERNIHMASGTRAHDKLQCPPELAQRLSGLMISDAMQAVSYLRRRPEIDRTRIAAVGYSMGSFVLSLTCALDDRLHACVLAGGGSLDGPGGYWDRSKPMCQGIPYESLSFLGDRAAVIFALHAFRGPTLVFNGLDDEIVRHDARGPRAFFADLQRRAAVLSGEPGNLFQTGFEPGAGHRPWFVTKPVALWLERQIDFPNWTRVRIEQMPITHISEWAKSNGVEIDKAYATEQREGGAMALGSGVRPPTRKQLSVFDAQQWEREKSHLTYEAWLNAARARLNGKGVLPCHKILRAPSRITIDGRLDDEAWKNAPSVGSFHFKSWDFGEKEQTDVKMLWDDENLYVAFYCHGRQLSVKARQRDVPASKGEYTGISLSPRPQKVTNCYTFEISAMGSISNRNETDWWKGAPDWEPEDVAYRTSLQNSTPQRQSNAHQGWAVELAIPFRNFAHDAAHTPPQPGDIWRLNLFRTGRLRDEQESSWSPVPERGRNWRDPTASGMVQFLARSP